MKARVKSSPILLGVFLLITLLTHVNGSVSNGYFCVASPVSCETPKVVLESGTAGTSTTYTNNTSAKVSVQATTDWLGGWGKRVKITINSSDIDEALTDFPILIHLSNSSGENDEDASFIFNEIGSNRKKIAVTTSNGTTQCYVEIEKWDANNEETWLWVGVPSVLSSADTDLYLYYDNDHADNTDYVGDTGSTPAENVWDSSFKMVQHLHETSGTHHDSTTSDNDGTPSSNLDQGLSAKIDGGDYFNGTSGEADYITWSENHFNFDYNDTFTFECWVKSTSGRFAFAKGNANWGYRLKLEGDGDLHFWMKVNGASRQIRRRVDAFVLDDAWHHIVATYNGSRDVSGLTIYADSNIPTTQGTNNNVNPGDSMQTDLVFYIGRNSGSTAYWYEGHIDEFRISNTTRSSAWIKATYESERDHLVDYGSEESATFDYVLKIVNQVTGNWTANLRVYDSYNISRISSLNISLHDGTSSNQIAISEGSIVKSEGEPYNLPEGPGSTIYIGMSNVQATSNGTSCLYVYLKILVPDISTYNLFFITFEIT